MNTYTITMINGHQVQVESERKYNETYLNNHVKQGESFVTGESSLGDEIVINLNNVLYIRKVR